MNIQMSFKNNNIGTLYVVPTPIGNLEDITFRALRVLENVDFILAEDTRHTQKLLTHFKIKNTLLSYHEHNKVYRTEYIINRLKSKEKIALVSDAGMPAISDPGYDLVKKVTEQNFHVIVLPGANAALCALIGSGLPTEEFLFHGFLPRKKKEKELVLNRLKAISATLIFYESPHRMLDTLHHMKKQLGNRNVAVVRELTKVYEQYVRGKLEEVIQWAEKNTIRGECCIVVEGSEQDDENSILWWASLSISEHVTYYEQRKNFTHKDAMKQVAVDRGLSRREVYQNIHVKKSE